MHEHPVSCRSKAGLYRHPASLAPPASRVLSYILGLHQLRQIDQSTYLQPIHIFIRIKQANKNIGQGSFFPSFHIVKPLNRLQGCPHILKQLSVEYLQSIQASKRATAKHSVCSLVDITGQDWRYLPVLRLLLVPHPLELPIRFLKQFVRASGLK
jgi:hypothetical protein